jgi:hypothetical protein
MIIHATVGGNVKNSVMEKLNSIVILCLILIGVLCCNSKTKNYPPKDLNETIEYFEETWSDSIKTEFINDSLRNAHFTIGRWIRNNWIYGERDTSLVLYFNKLGIYHPDDISSIILTSLFRKLTGKPINLEEQVEEFKSYWKPIIDCEEKAKKLAMENYYKLKIGDELNIYMEVDTSYGENLVVIRDCPNPEWIFDNKKDLKIYGVVTEKYNINDTANVFIKVKILKMNKNRLSGTVEEKKPGDIEDFSMEFLKFEILN